MMHSMHMFSTHNLSDAVVSAFTCGRVFVAFVVVVFVLANHFACLFVVDAIKWGSV